MNHVPNPTMNPNPIPQRPVALATRSSDVKNCFRFDRLLLFTAAVCLLTVSPARVLAVTNTWSGGGADDNWSTDGNWDGGAPTAGSDVLFTGNDAAPGSGWSVGGGTPNNIVSASLTLDSFWSRPSNAWHVAQIPLGSSLTITGALPVTNLVSLGTNYYAIWVGAQHNQAMFQSITGQGQLIVNNTNAMVSVRNVLTGNGSRATLDMSGLDTFTANVIGISVGGDGTTAASNNDRPGGILYLAKTNLITSPATAMTRPATLSTLILTIGDCIVSTGPASFVYLGDTNTFLGDSGIAVGWRRGNGTLQFNSPNGVAYFRNRAGTGRQNYWAVGDNLTGNTGFGSTGNADFTAGRVDAMVDILYVGRGQSAGAAIATGTLRIGNGIIDVNSVNIGIQKANNGAPANGTVLTSGGSSVTNLVVNGNVLLGSVVGGTGASTTVGTLTINSSVIVKGRIIGGDAPNTTINFGTLDSASLWIGGKLGNNGGVNDKPINNLNLNAGTLTLDLGTSGNPVSPVCNANNLSIGAITVNVSGAGLSPGLIPLIKSYTSLSGSFAGITQGSLPQNTVGYFSNTTDTLYFVVTATDSPKWNGNLNGDWDINTTSNWLTGIMGNPTTYHQTSVPGEGVLFDDTASGTTTVNLTTALSPVAISVNNPAKTYTFAGIGGISGPAALTKQGAGTLVVANSGTNDFTGPVTIAGGKVQLDGGANRLPTNAVVSLSDVAGVVLDLNGQNQRLSSLAGGGINGGGITLGAGTLTFSGNGSDFAGIISGNGQLVKTNSGTQILSGANTYGGGTIISGGTLTVANATGSGISFGNLLIAAGTLQIGNGSVSGSIAQGVITNNGVLALNRNDDIVFTNIVTGSGSLLKSGNNTVFLQGPNSYTGSTTINDGVLRVGDPAALGNGVISIGGSGGARLELSNNVILPQSIQVASKGGALGAPPHVLNLSDTNFLTGMIDGTSAGTDWSFQSDGGKLIISGTLTNRTTSASQILNLRGTAFGEWQGRIADGALSANVTSLTKRDSGTWVLTSSSVNTYTGPTVVSAGTLVVNGAILNSVGLQIGAFATLAGNGLIARPVTNAALSTLSPGSSIGTLTISNTLTLQPGSISLFEVSASGNDQVRGLSSVTFGGKLQVVPTEPITGNAAFKLFTSAAYTGSFAELDLPVLSAPLSWDTSQLDADGTLRIIGGPAISNLGIAANGSFQMSGTGAADQPYRILATTNISTPLANWIEVGNGTFSGGAFSFTDMTSTNFPQRFYRVVTP